MTKKADYKLLIAGVLLSLSGFVLGALIPTFTNPRMALSAHEQGIIAGAFLMILGLVWPQAAFFRNRSRLSRGFIITGPYMIWTGILLASIFGTSRATSIAGDGFTGTKGEEILVSVILMTGSILTIAGMILLLIALVRSKRQQKE